MIVASETMRQLHEIQPLEFTNIREVRGEYANSRRKSTVLGPFPRPQLHHTRPETFIFNGLLFRGNLHSITEADFDSIVWKLWP